MDGAFAALALFPRGYFPSAGKPCALSLPQIEMYTRSCCILGARLSRPFLLHHKYAGSSCGFFSFPSATSLGNSHQAVHGLSTHPFRKSKHSSRNADKRKTRTGLQNGGTLDLELERLQNEGTLDLELELLKFMENSDKPLSFPTKSELLKAGRADLVNGIIRKGGWLVAGWDLSDQEQEGVSNDQMINTRTDAKRNKPHNNGSARRDQAALTLFKDHAGATIPVRECKKSDDDQFHTSIQTSECSFVVGGADDQRACTDIFGIECSTHKPGHDGDKLHAFALKDHNTLTCHEKPQIVCEVHPGSVEGAMQQRRKRKKRVLSLADKHTNIIVEQTVDRINKTFSRRNEWLKQVELTSHKQPGGLRKDEPIFERIHWLELELISTLDMLQYGRLALSHDIKLEQVHNINIAEFGEASDALEFFETDVMNKSKELRKVRAQLTASQGKLALELTKAQKDIERRDKKIKEAMEVVKLTRKARIIWAHPGADIYLSGSFDGWTTPRKMQKSSAGVFVTALQLYPGRYEIKFIVDGEWRVDPNRPIICTDGYENNVLSLI